MTRDELDKRINERLHQPMVLDGVELVEHAKQYALKMHGDQKYGDQPYSVHLEDVESVLIEFDHISSTLRAAAWLHDLEDIFKLDSEESRELFRSTMLNEFKDSSMKNYLYVIVEAVTSEPGKNRKERNAKTYQKIVNYRYAVIVKLADRIANGRKSKASDPGKYSMYKKEYPEFRQIFYTSDIDILPMWWELDRLFDFQGV